MNEFTIALFIGIAIGVVGYHYVNKLIDVIRLKGISKQLKKIADRLEKEKTEV